MIQSNPVALPATQISRVHNFTDNSPGMVESTYLDILLCDEFVFGARLNRGLGGRWRLHIGRHFGHWLDVVVVRQR